jgi:TetR/AcrR family transcriptional repressor of lmrAB and yxaGH operons
MTRAVSERADVIPLIAEAFRDLGYDGASMSRITERTGLGKGSLYHFFPGGKEEMASAVLAEVDEWFDRHIFVPLREREPRVAIGQMWRGVDEYFRSGRRVCLVGAFALDETRDRFAGVVADYFWRWIEALSDALRRAGCAPDVARELAEDAVIAIQGAIVLSRALDDTEIFARTLDRLSARLGA